MATLVEQLGKAPKREQVIHDCVELIDAQVKQKNFLIKGAYSTIKAIKKGFVQETVDTMLDERRTVATMDDYAEALHRGGWIEHNDPVEARRFLATLEVRGRGLVVQWDAGEVHAGRYDEPDLHRVARIAIS